MDNKKILEKVQMKIAISNSKEEDIVLNKNKMSIKKGIGIAACIILSTTGVVFATSNLIKKFGGNSSDGVQTAVENGYVQELSENSIIDSFLIDNYNFYIAFKADKINKNINELRSMEKNILTIKNEKGEIIFQDNKDAYGLNEEDNKIIYTATAKEFPISSKLFVNFDGIQEVLDVPSNMQNNIEEYKLKSISDENIEFEKAYLSSTAFKIYLSNCNGIAWNDKECVETADGNKFYPAHRSDGDGEISIAGDGIVRYYNTFNLTRFDATDTLIIHLFKNDGSEIAIELTK